MLKNELENIDAIIRVAYENCEILNEKIIKTDISLEKLYDLKQKLAKEKEDLEKSINHNDAAKEKLINDPNRHIELMRNSNERKNTEDSINQLEEKKEEYKKERSKIKSKLNENEQNYGEFRGYYEQINTRYEEALEKEMKGFDEVQKNAENFRNENISKQMKFLKELGIMFQDEEEEKNFIQNYTDLQAHYFEFINSKRHVNEAASSIETEMKNIIYYLEIINKKLEHCETFFKPENIKEIIWDLVIFFFSKKFNIAYKNDDMDFLYKIVSIAINSKKNKSNIRDDDDDDDDEDSPSNRNKKAFNLVFKDLAPSSTFRELEQNESFVSSFLDFCTTKIDEIQSSKRQANSSIKTIEKKEKDENKKQEGIRKLEEEIEKLEEEIDEYKENKTEIKKITYVMNDFRLQANKFFLKEIIANVKTQLFSTLLKQIDELEDSKTVREIHY
jgi:hypothetical protein